MADLAELPPFDAFAEGTVTLRFRRIVVEPGRGLVPFLHFAVRAGGQDVGHINLRVGDTDHVRLYVGHIGFSIDATHRGHGDARVACLALASLVRCCCGIAALTCSPENVASRRTIERLGGEFLGEVVVPPHDPHYRQPGQIKRRYAWSP